MPTKFELEWVDTTLQSELRWGRKTAKGLANSTRIALITRDSNKVTDKGTQTRYKIEMALLFKNDEDTPEQLTFETLEYAKVGALQRAAVKFSELLFMADKMAEGSPAE